ncbi:nitrite reductase (NAD(P)H) small subunit [Allonocardiopsis opalescens]|uniref:Nitrite reductase (NADH) small subunit n=1 Tax=Allonocardiopsis opalescens TaxID=1144618 RepID=A0A2T0QDK8_9ACTN|nr:nitrite reductase (NAD(P)H) small subunit [Allonocardiopsis opalescens]PRY02036.1 nitrite reductase (NADH) small subunit [Allonocardiopsis opalescens]
MSVPTMVRVLSVPDPLASPSTGRLHWGAIALGDWIDAGPVADLVAGHGHRALLRGCQIAVFRTPAGTVHALDDFDPVSGAYGLSSGAVADVGGVPSVWSPSSGRRFDLCTGRCLDLEGARTVEVYPVQVRAGRVEVGLP